MTYQKDYWSRREHELVSTTRGWRQFTAWLFDPHRPELHYIHGRYYDPLYELDQNGVWQFALPSRPAQVAQRHDLYRFRRHHCEPSLAPEVRHYRRKHGHELR